MKIECPLIIHRTTHPFVDVSSSSCQCSVLAFSVFFCLFLFYSQKGRYLDFFFFFTQRGSVVQVQ